MMAMTNRPVLRLLLFSLLAVSSLVSSSQDELKHSNSTKSNDTTGPEIQSTIVPKVPVTQTAEGNEENFGRNVTTAHHASEMTTSQSSKGNETFEGFHSSERTESNTTKVAGIESPAGNESSNQTESPVRNSSSGPMSLPGSSALTVEPRVVTNKQATHSAVAVATTTSRSPTLRTVFPPSTTKKQTPTKGTTTSSEVINDHICPTEASKREGLVGRCLIAIALLAALVTIFIMSTIILATKLAASRYRNREGLLQETEMVCISALMNDTEHPIPKPRHPKSNGALIPNTEDEDGDDLTLNSFLPDTEGVA
ncbi:P-selectin glycoprotein ligand 1 [Colossoma macropomum]|uniref:P-selectin glycoprotein ligand 1 n=1 Tax=Colossoma macropomum TaxID=42526 RepID=UPI0018641DD2|nr:P-selectin glycoprotein ligand 1 [Colossoma macropomum]XP_036453850.1 P-selectin glycoprotein ligand 1 [Colossoma macropomum]